MGRHKTYHRDEVLDKAMKLFWKRGYAGAHLQELVKVTGLNRFSLYKEFGGKEGLFREAMARYLAWLKQLTAVLLREPAGLANIFQYLTDLLRVDFSHGCFMVNVLIQRSVVPAAVTDQLREFIAGIEAALLKNLQAAQAQGDLAADLDVQAVAKFLVVFDIGMVTHELLEPSRQDKELIAGVVLKLLGQDSVPQDLQQALSS